MDRVVCDCLFGVLPIPRFFIWGLKYLPAGQAAVIVATNPVFTTLWQFFYLKKNGIDG